VQAGKVVHKLKVGGNDSLEIYDYPGAYAQRFDGISPGGGEQPDKLQKIFDDNARTVAIRMQQEALPSLLINAANNCGHLVSGYKFTLTRHFNADGVYVITSLSHSGQPGIRYRPGQRSPGTFLQQHLHLYSVRAPVSSSACHAAAARAGFPPRYRGWTRRRRNLHR